MSGLRETLVPPQPIKVYPRNTKAQKLRQWNYGVALVHTASFIALTTISFIRLSDVMLTRFVSLWAVGVYEGFGPILGQYPIFATLIPFPAITAVFHVAAAWGALDYYKDVLGRGRNTLRWIEYGITNGLMSWSLVFVAGGTGANFWIATACVVSNFLMQYFGYLYEHSDPKLHRRHVYFIAIGFLPWIFNWTWVAVYYINRIATVSLSDHFAVIGSLLWSLAFVAPLIYGKMSRNPDRAAVRYNIERAYALLSLSAKLWLDWTVTVGNLVGN